MMRLRISSNENTVMKAINLYAPRISAGCISLSLNLPVLAASGSLSCCYSTSCCAARTRANFGGFWRQSFHGAAAFLFAQVEICA